MVETFTALILAHVVADFLGQPDAMIRRKAEPLVLLLHIVIVGLLSLAALGGAWQIAVAVAGAHLVIDAIKTWALPAQWRDSLPAFLVDQAAHIATLIAAALWIPDAVASGLWADRAPDLRSPVILLIGAIVSIWGGGYAVGLLMKP